MTSLTIGLSGRYKLETLGPDGEVRNSVDWFDNLITNLGLDLFSGMYPAKTGSSFYHCIMKVCSVGTATATPLVTDTQLGAHTATTGAQSSSVQTNDVPSRVFSYAITYDFAVGAAAGNLSEIGVGYDTTSMFSRALIKDGAGDPTTITVLADEVLRVTYEVRVNVPTGIFTSVADGYTFGIKAGAAAGTGPADRLASNISWVFFMDGAVGATIDDLPGGAALASYVPVAGAYTLGSYTLAATVSVPLSGANGSILSLKWQFGPIYWQCSISPAIEKDNTKLLSIGFTLTWAREGELPP